MSETETQIALMQKDIKNLVNDLGDLKKESKEFHLAITKKLDEWAKKWGEIGSLMTFVEGTNKNMNKLDERVDKIEQELVELRPMKKLVYGLVGLILVEVVSALIYVVLK